VSKARPREEVAKLVAYDAPEPSADIVLVANENPENLPEPVLDEMQRLMTELSFNRYPDPRAQELCKALAEANGVAPENVICGNGGDEILVMCCLAFGGAGRTALTFPPTFAMFSIISASTGTALRAVPRRDDFTLDIDAACEAAAGCDIVFLANPNNPTGTMESREAVADLARSARGLFVLDEAYCEFAGTTYADLLDEHDNVLVLRTFSKAFSMAGLRVGYALGSGELIAQLQKVRLPYNSNAFSQAAATIALQYRELFDERVGKIVSERERVMRILGETDGVTAYPSAANYILIRVGQADLVWQKLLDSGVLVRNFAGDERLDDFLRVTVGTADQNDHFLAALGRALPRWAT